MGSTTITIETFLDAAAEFLKISDRIGDGWKLNKNNTDTYKTYLKKDTFIQLEDENNISNLLKVEYVIYYNLSYGVPSFSFNIWNSTGSLLSLDDIRKVSAIQ